MSQIILPAIWLLIFIVGLPQLSETVYTPALPDIAKALQVPESQVEYTLTIYLVGFALGTLFWGKLSDHFGRKPCIVMGLLIFTLGSLGCHLSDSISLLMISRFVQAFGGSIGSVLGQAVARDSFHGPDLSKIYASVGSALALYPAVGPVLGGFIAQHYGWSNIFIFLMIFGLGLTILVLFSLPETYHVSKRRPVAIKQVLTQLIYDKRALCLGLLVAGCNGISFSYFAEGSFYLQSLGLTPSEYGLTFIAIAASTIAGGLLSKKLHVQHLPEQIMKGGIITILAGSSIFTLVIFLHVFFLISSTLIGGVAIGAQMIMMFGSCLVTSNALALALVNYKWCIGTASSLFGFFYYTVISLFTFVMGLLHDGTLYPMPLFFVSLSIMMFVISKVVIRNG